MTPVALVKLNRETLEFNRCGRWRGVDGAGAVARSARVGQAAGTWG